MDEAIAVLDQALAIVPSPRFKEARAIALRRGSRLRESAAYMDTLLAEHGEEAWLHHQLGAVLSDWDRPRANAHLGRAGALQPDDMGDRMA
ncbi:MAG TPA: hypothetical protein PKA17_04875, partial [Phenylobacterium sp.]|nr:hypothetical protein [Phenylobacterium sp.]